jgi:Family of unknown function (DUF6516)
MSTMGGKGTALAYVHHLCYIHHMAAIPLIFLKRRNADGTIIDIKISQLPDLTAERPHGLKCSLFYGRAGERIIGYDNETGKGDHRHFGTREAPYAFESMERLVQDFFADVATESGE